VYAFSSVVVVPGRGPARWGVALSPRNSKPQGAASKPQVPLLSGVEAVCAPQAMEEEEGVVSALWDRLAENVSAALSKVTTKCWALHGHASAASGAGAGGLEDGLPPRHVPLIWLMHDTSFPTVLSIRFNDTETSRTQLTKAQLTHQVNNDQVVQFKVLGLQVMLLVHCEVEASWLSTTYKYTYKCTVDGKDLKENLESVAAGRTAAGAAREEGVLVPNELSQHVTVPEFREVPAKRDPSTGLASTNELLAEFKVSLRLNGGKTVEQWHRFSHFANMHAALRSCVRDTPVRPFSTCSACAMRAPC
jgi:hypothetical protein